MSKYYAINTPFKNKDIENKLWEGFQKIKKDGSCLKVLEIEENLMILKRWLISAPRNVVYRVNTLLSDTKKIVACIENELHAQMKAKGHCRKLPSITVFESIPELIIVNCWNEDIDLDLEIQSKEVIVDGKCGEAVIRGADIFAPGVIGMPHGLKVGQIVSVFADIVKDCKKGLVKKYADENKLFLGNGIVQMTREDIFGHEIKNVNGIAVKIIDVISRLPQLNDKNFQTGWCLLQNLPSIICSRILDPQPGEIVLDMCAAPGHKTTHISALMKNKGTVIAIEKNKNKLQALKKHCENFGATNVRCFCFDSTKALANEEEKEITLEPPFLRETFDRILLDGPCSALGQRPQFSNTITLAQLNSHVPLQKNLFSTAVELLKSGGTLVYSTCTITVGENENIVAWALKKYPALKLQSIKHKIPLMKIPDCGASGFNIEGLSLEESDSLLRFGPESNSIGFFIACFTKEKIL